MFLPFKLPHAGLQAMRQRWFYSRVVFYYKIAHQFDLFNKKCVRFEGWGGGRAGGGDPDGGGDTAPAARGGRICVPRRPGCAPCSRRGRGVMDAAGPPWRYTARGLSEARTRIFPVQRSPRTLASPALPQPVTAAGRCTGSAASSSA